MTGRREQVVGWTLAAGLVALCSAGFAVAGLPSPLLFGAVTGAMAYAVLGTGRRLPRGLLGRTGGGPDAADGPDTADSSRVAGAAEAAGSGVLPALVLPNLAPIVGQAVIGVSIGALVDPGTVGELAGRSGVALLVAGIVTLAASVAAGWSFAWRGALAPATGVFSMIAGGASGITAIARELGADDRVVSVVQYVRVLMILLGMPLIATLVFHPVSTGAALEVGGDTAWPVSLAYVVGAGVVGVGLGRWARLPAGALLGPLAVSMGVGLWSASRGVTLGVPDLVLAAGYLLIGAHVGLRFTRAALASIARLLPLSLALIAAVVVVCAAFGAVLAAWTGQSPLDGYLATTPGGLYAVLAIAVDSGSDVAFVLAAQVIRLLLVLAAAPLLARMLRGGRPRGGRADPDVDS